MAQPRRPGYNPPKKEISLEDVLDTFLLAPAVFLGNLACLIGALKGGCVLNITSLKALWDAYRSGTSIDLTERGLISSDELNAAHDNGKVVCIHGELQSANGETYQVPINGNGSVAKCLAYTQVIFVDQGGNTTKTRQSAAQLESNSSFALPLACTLSGVVAVDPELLTREPRLYEAIHANPSKILPSLLPREYRAGGVVPLPRSAHTYMDFFAGVNWKVLYMYVPNGLRCLVVGRLVLDGGKLTVTAHPVAGLQLLSGSSPEVLLADLTASALGPMQRLQDIIEACEQGLSVSLTCACVLGGAWLVSRLCVALFRLGPPPPPPAAPPQAQAAAPSAHAEEAQANGHAGECIICLDAPSDTALVPCGHVSFCQQCAPDLRRHGITICPICKQPWQSAMRIFPT